MADITIIYLTYIAIILIVGLISSIISEKLKIPNFLLLIFFGVIIANSPYTTDQIEFSPIFLTSLAILTLALIVFDATSRLKLKEFDDLSFSALKLTLVFLLFNCIFLTATTYLFLNEKITPMLALLFATIMAGTSPSTTLMSFKGQKSKMLKLLEVESIINTPMIVFIPFILISIIEDVGKSFTFDAFVSHLSPFVQQFITGIGIGIIAGIILFKVMRKKYSPVFSPIALIASTLLTYALAENFGGNGVLAVTTAGLLFGNLFIEHKQKLMEFSSTFSLLLEILVFVLIGIVIKVPLTRPFFITSISLFIIYLIIRFFTVSVALSKENYSAKEKIFMSLNVPKGIAVAVIAFTLSTKAITGINHILDLILAFMVYSIILSTILTKFIKHFTEEK